MCRALLRTRLANARADGLLETGQSIFAVTSKCSQVCCQLVNRLQLRQAVHCSIVRNAALTLRNVLFVA